MCNMCKKPLMYDEQLHQRSYVKPFLKRHILDFSKLKDFADDNFSVDENGGFSNG